MRNGEFATILVSSTSAFHPLISSRRNHCENRVIRWIYFLDFQISEYIATLASGKQYRDRLRSGGVRLGLEIYLVVCTQLLSYILRSHARWAQLSSHLIHPPSMIHHYYRPRLRWLQPENMISSSYLGNLCLSQFLLIGVYSYSGYSINQKSEPDSSDQRVPGQSAIYLDLAYQGATYMSLRYSP